MNRGVVVDANCATCRKRIENRKHFSLNIPYLRKYVELLWAGVLLGIRNFSVERNHSGVTIFFFFFDRKELLFFFFFAEQHEFFFFNNFNLWRLFL